jgi:TM2 domain-containing membrane protein YozV
LHKIVDAFLMSDDDPDFSRGTPSDPKIVARERERRFLEWAYAPDAPIDVRAPEVAHVLKCAIADAEAMLEELAARDSLSRSVDDEGFVFYRLPGRRPAPSKALVKHEPQKPVRAVTPVEESTATMGLVLNLVMPGVGSIVAGRTGEGIAQLVLFIVGLPLCFLLIGIPLCVAVWGWALATGLRAVSDAQKRRDERE